MKKLHLILFLILCSFHLFSQYKTFSGIYDTQFDYIDRKLEKFGFGKVVYYYDDMNKKDGEWELYPKILLSDTTTIIDESLGVNISILLDIDSSRNSRVKLHDDYMNETNIVTTQMSKIEYKQLLQILSAFDLSMLSEDFANKGKDITKYEAKPLRISKDIVIYGSRGTKECSNSVFEIRYNDLITKCKGCSLVPFYYPALKDFLLRYISTKSYQSGRNPKILY